MKTTRLVRRASAVHIAAVLGVAAPGAANAVERDAITLIRHSTVPLRGYGTLNLEIWTDGTNVQVIGLDRLGQIVLAREGILRGEPMLEETGALAGIVPAQRRVVRGGRTVEQLRCTTVECARSMAARAESIVRASQMGAAEGPDETTTMATLCPTKADAKHAYAATPAIAALAASEPCKWRPVQAAALGLMPPVGRHTVVLIDNVAHRLRRARWMIRPDTP